MMSACKCRKQSRTYRTSTVCAVNTEELGVLVVGGFDYTLCSKCGALWLDGKQKKALQDIVNGHVEQYLGKFPIGDFISEEKAIEVIYGVGAKRLRKHILKKDLDKLYYKCLGEDRLFLESSVLAYRRNMVTGTGRFNLIVEYAKLYAEKQIQDKMRKYGFMQSEKSSSHLDFKPLQ